jgi:hypothetical protein
MHDDMICGKRDGKGGDSEKDVGELIEGGIGNDGLQIMDIEDHKDGIEEGKENESIEDIEKIVRKGDEEETEIEERKTEKTEIDTCNYHSRGMKKGGDRSGSRHCED